MPPSPEFDQTWERLVRGTGDTSEFEHVPACRTALELAFKAIADLQEERADGNSLARARLLIALRTDIVFLLQNADLALAVPPWEDIPFSFGSNGDAEQRQAAVDYGSPTGTLTVGEAFRLFPAAFVWFART